jgi:hypothetical protein
MAELPSLADLLQIVGGGGVALGGIVGFVLPADDGTSMADNVVRWSGVGLVLGLIFAFEIWAVLQLEMALR